MTSREPNFPPIGAKRLVVGAFVIVAAIAGSLALLRDGDVGHELASTDPAASVAPAAAGNRHNADQSPAIPSVFEPDADGKLTIPARALTTGKPIQVTLRLAPEEIGDQPMTASIRTDRKTHELGVAQLDRATGRANLSIDPSRLTPGTHLLAIRVASDSWNPNRRIAITVTDD